MPGFRWTGAEIDIVRKNYNRNPGDLLGLLSNRTKKSIIHKAAQLGLSKRQIYSHDKKFFGVPTNESCYWAGFVAADGSISRDGYLRIGLSGKDRIQLENFVRAVNFDGPIVFYYNNSNHPCVRMRLDAARVLIMDLEEVFNVAYNKSQYLPPPNLIDESHILAYMVGYIDGDGCICITRDNYLSLKIVSSTKEILDWFKYWFDLWDSGIRACPAIPRKISGINCYEYRIEGNRVRTILNKLLVVRVPRLERKWNKVKIINNERESD